MAIPSWLNYDARYLLTLAITDVNTIISDLQSELVTNGTWSEPSAGVYKSEVDALGRYVQITTSRVSATRMQWKLTEYFGNTIYDGTIDIDAGGTNVEYFSGPGYCWIGSLRATTEAAYVFKLDPTPEPDVDPWPFIGWAQRNSAGTANTVTFNNSAINSTTNGTYTISTSFNTQQYNLNNTALGSGMSYSGAYTFWPVITFHNFSGVYSYAGKAPNCLVSNEAFTAGVEADVPIDTGTTKTFRAVSSAKGLDAGYNLRLLIKKST